MFEPVDFTIPFVPDALRRPPSEWSPPVDGAPEWLTPTITANEDRCAEPPERPVLAMRSLWAAGGVLDRQFSCTASAAGGPYSLDSRRGKPAWSSSLFSFVPRGASDITTDNLLVFGMMDVSGRYLTGRWSTDLALQRIQYVGPVEQPSMEYFVGLDFDGRAHGLWFGGIPAEPGSLVALGHRVDLPALSEVLRGSDDFAAWGADVFVARKTNLLGRFRVEHYRYDMRGASAGTEPALGLLASNEIAIPPDLALRVAQERRRVGLALSFDRTRNVLYAGCFGWLFQLSPELAIRREFSFLTPLGTSDTTTIPHWGEQSEYLGRVWTRTGFDIEDARLCYVEVSNITSAPATELPEAFRTNNSLWLYELRPDCVALIGVSNPPTDLRRVAEAVPELLPALAGRRQILPAWSTLSLGSTKSAADNFSLVASGPCYGDEFDDCPGPPGGEGLTESEELVASVGVWGMYRTLPVVRWRP